MKKNPFEMPLYLSLHPNSIGMIYDASCLCVLTTDVLGHIDEDLTEEEETERAEYAVHAINMHENLIGTLGCLSQELDWARRMVHNLGVYARNDIPCEQSTALSDSVQDRLWALVDNLAALLKEEEVNQDG